ncbi:MAG: cell division protein SepF [Defluviitaleaceae bacterium]|nr:cell division protein SepF [Defluviitaleaceae bacterium]
MVSFFKRLGDRIAKSMVAPGADEHYADYDYDYGYEDELEDEYVPEAREPRAKAPQPKARAASSTASSSSARRASNVFDFAQKASASSYEASQAEIIYAMPDSLDYARDFLRPHILNGRTCILKMDVDSPEVEAQRIADYLCGICEGIGGSFHRIGVDVFTFSPANHRVMPDSATERAFDTNFFSKAK